MLYKLQLFIWRFFGLNKPTALGKYVCVYFPNVNKFFTVIVTSVRKDTFTGIFNNINDYSKSRVADDYNQIENDILFDLNTYLPIDKR